MGIPLTINPEVVLPLLFSSGVDGDTSVPASVGNQSAAEGQHPAAGQHLGHSDSDRLVHRKHFPTASNRSNQFLCILRKEIKKKSQGSGV